MTELRVCTYCGKQLNGDTYIIHGRHYFCSEEHWRAYQDEEARWEDEGGSVFADPGMGFDRPDIDPGMSWPRNHHDPRYDYHGGGD